MAEEGVSLPVTPEISKPDGNNLRRSSTGKVSSSNGGETIVPHYLRASTGSCHDFCKYGRAHAMEAKATHPVRKRVVKKSPDREDLLGSVDLQDSEMAAVELKLSSDSKSQTSDFSSVIKEEVSKQSLAGKNPTGTEVLWQRKKTSGVKFKSSAPMKCRPSDTPKIMKEEVSSSSEKVEVLFVKRSLKAKNLSSSAAYATSLKPKSLTARNLSSSVDYATSLKPKSLTAKNLSSSVDYSTSLKPKSLTAKNLSSSADYASSLKPKSLAVKPATSLKPKSLAVKPPTSLKPKALTVKPPTSLKPKALTVKPATTLMPNSVTVTPATSLKPKSSTGKPISSANTSGIGRSLRKGDAKVGKTTGPKVAIKKALPSPTASLSSKVSVNNGAGLSERKHRELKDVSPLLNESEIEKAEPKKPSTDEVEEKTLYVIKMETENKPLDSDQNEAFATEFSPALSPSPKFLSIPDAMETENKPLESDQNEAFATEFSPGLSPSPKFSSTPNALSSSSYEEESQDVSECMTSEAEWDSLSEDNELENIEEADTLEEGYKDGSTKARMLSSEEKNCQPMKLNFRRGKVIDVHSVDDRPRRLKFRRGKLSGGNQNVRAGARKRSFTRTKAAGGDMESSEPDSQKVVLRHQDVQGKKDAQGLFNNVIEETASKLVATRKSKVKALVGAFETVISLQDKNPAANAVE